MNRLLQPMSGYAIKLTVLTAATALMAGSAGAQVTPVWRLRFSGLLRRHRSPSPPPRSPLPRRPCLATRTLRRSRCRRLRRHHRFRPQSWDAVSVQDLLNYIQQVGKEGLNPGDYDPVGLEAVIATRNPLLMSQAATERFNRLSSDLALGHVKKPGPHRLVGRRQGSGCGRAGHPASLCAGTENIRAALDNLLPTYPQYAALKSALELTPATDTAKINRIRLNMDRWRWLPRDLGQKYIIVNVPGFHATLVENGVNRWKQRAIAGSVKTPTPQLWRLRPA